MDWDALEVTALGVLQMTERELYEITPRAFYNKLEGHQQKDRDQWERTRYTMWAALLPHTGKNKALQLKDVLPFPWDGAAAPKKDVKLQERIERKNKIWENLDRRRQDKNSE